MKKDSSKRIGNISAIPSSYPEQFFCDIVKWYPNVYYGQKDKYEPVPDRPHMYQPKNEDYKFSVDETAFDIPECSYIVAYITNGTFPSYGTSPDVVSVGFRPWELGNEDQESFKKILEYIHGILNNGEQDE